MRLRFLLAFHDRHPGVRLCLALFCFGWTFACLFPFPPSRAYHALSVLPHLAWSALGLLGGLGLLLARTRANRMRGAAYAALFWMTVSLTVTVGNHALSTGTITYGLLSLLAFDYLTGGAK